MLKIKLNKPVYFDKKYVVYLDSSNKFSFKNKRQAEDFIRKISKESDRTLLFITENLNDLECFYKLFNLLDNDYKFKHLASNVISYVDNRITWISERSGSENHDAILFHALLTCLQELRTGFALVEEKALQHKDTLTKKRCALKADIIKMYESQLTKIEDETKELHVKIAKR
jgi:hypothetical protein